MHGAELSGCCKEGVDVDSFTDARAKAVTSAVISLFKYT
jgi:hypothetical protein